MIDKGAAVVVGASGGIGAALADALDASQRYARVWRMSRAGVSGPRIDITDSASVTAAAHEVAAAGVPLRCVIVASGILHEQGRGPERALREIDAAWMARVFAVNTIGPALVAQAFLPLFPRETRNIFAALSARVGSISDNRLGGWHSYRASKAALNMLIRNFAIELARTHRETICIGLHPGTVDTPLSKPFQRNVAATKLFDADTAAAMMLATLDRLSPTDSGQMFAWDGELIAP